MCGVAGIFDLEAKREVDRNALMRMSDAIAHRGPDDAGRHLAPGVGIIHRRLAVIDKAGGAQPFKTAAGAVLSYNGEIYNYQSLQRTLSSHVNFKTRSDTEVLAEGLALEGPDFIHKLRGMFAFAFWTPGKQRLMLARDRLGERPLYYAVSADGFLLFASEISAIAASGMIASSIDLQAFADYCYYGYVPDPKSIFRNVYKLPPAHMLFAERNGALRLERYWRPVFAANNAISFDESAELLKAKLDEAVRLQTVADAPVGAFLSGGVDSAGVFASMAEAQSETTLNACTIGFGEGAGDERAAAKEIASKYNAIHHESEARIDNIDLIDRVATVFGEPFADPSALSSYSVAQLAKEHMTVALTGDGGDEIFAGYRRHRFFIAEERIRKMAPHALRLATFGAAGALYPKLDWAPRPMRLKTTLKALAEKSAVAYASASAINLPAHAAAMRSRDVTRALAGYQPESLVAHAMAEADTDEPLACAQYADLKTWLPGRMLVKLDRASMAHALETRPPLLDHTLVEWAGGLPANYKLKSGVGKRILKRALEPRLGQAHLNRKKLGFAPPVGEWLRRDCHNPVERLHDSRLWRECGLLHEKHVEKMIRAHRSGRANCAQELWSVIMFDAFLRTSGRQ